MLIPNEMEKLIITQKAILSYAYVGFILPADLLCSSVDFANANYFRIAHYQREIPWAKG